MYLNRDVPNPNKTPVSEDDDPVDIDVVFKMYVHSALTIAQAECQRLKDLGLPYKRSAIDFWCDMVDDLNQMELDIKLTEE